MSARLCVGSEGFGSRSRAVSAKQESGGGCAQTLANLTAELFFQAGRLFERMVDQARQHNTIIDRSSASAVIPNFINKFRVFTKADARFKQSAKAKI